MFKPGDKVRLISFEPCIDPDDDWIAPGDEGIVLADLPPQSVIAAGCPLTVSFSNNAIKDAHYYVSPTQIEHVSRITLPPTARAKTIDQCPKHNIPYQDFGRRKWCWKCGSFKNPSGKKRKKHRIYTSFPPCYLCGTESAGFCGDCAKPTCVKCSEGVDCKQCFKKLHGFINPHTRRNMSTSDSLKRVADEQAREYGHDPIVHPADGNAVWVTCRKCARGGSVEDDGGMKIRGMLYQEHCGPGVGFPPTGLQGDDPYSSMTVRHNPFKYSGFYAYDSLTGIWDTVWETAFDAKCDVKESLLYMIETAGPPPVHVVVEIWQGIPHAQGSQIVDVVTFPGTDEPRHNPDYAWSSRAGKFYGPYTRRQSLPMARIRSAKGSPQEVWERTGGRQRLVRKYVGGKAAYRAPGTEHPFSKRSKKKKATKKKRR